MEKEKRARLQRGEGRIPGRHFEGSRHSAAAVAALVAAAAAAVQKNYQELSKTPPPPFLLHVPSLKHHTPPVNPPTTTTTNVFISVIKYHCHYHRQHHRHYRPPSASFTHHIHNIITTPSRTHTIIITYRHPSSFFLSVYSFLSQSLSFSLFSFLVSQS